jgi:hypothetical protein
MCIIIIHHIEENLEKTRYDMYVHIFNFPSCLEGVIIIIYITVGVTIVII